MAALNQPAFLQTQVGIPEMYRTCFSIYPCNTPYATTKGMDFIAKPDMNRARQLLKDSGYDGTPVVLLETERSGHIEQVTRRGETTPHPGRFQSRYASHGF